MGRDARAMELCLAELGPGQGSLAQAPLSAAQLMPTQAATVSIWVCKEPLLLPDDAHECSPITRLLGSVKGLLFKQFCALSTPLVPGHRGPQSVTPAQQETAFPGMTFPEWRGDRWVWSLPIRVHANTRKSVCLHAVCRCTWACLHIHMHMRADLCITLCICACTYTAVPVYMWCTVHHTWICVCVHVCMHIPFQPFFPESVYVCANTCICVCACRPECVPSLISSELLSVSPGKDPRTFQLGLHALALRIWVLGGQPLTS